MSRKIIIIGCGAAGSTAAFQARKTDRQAEILLLTAEDRPEYSRCGLPHVIGDIIPSFDDLQEFSAEWYRKTIKADLRLKVKATTLDVSKKTLEIQNLETNTSEPHNYDALIICSGGQPSAPPIKGIESSSILRLRTINDAIQIQTLARDADTAIVIGGGLIGLEIAEALNIQKVKTAVIEFLPDILLAMVDQDMAKMVRTRGEEEGITFLVNHSAVAIESMENDTSAHRVTVRDRTTEEDKVLESDLVIIATGVKPEIDFAKDGGVKIGELGGILTNNRMETSHEGVYAAGDCIESVEFFTKNRILAGMGTLAVRQGMVAGINAAGGSTTMPDALVTRVTKLFGLEIGGVGLTQHTAADQIKSPIATTIGKGSSLPNYFPGGKDLYLKLIFNQESGLILGSQIIGEEQAAQRLNTLACAIQNKNTVYDLANLETCYAPPVAPTWDVITTTALAAMRRVRKT
ncbi:MAG: FAD-dependent oxidoreductase [Candidatus Ranarchaeia archaeon]|jgi:NADH oxidase (H2O2-forming)